MRYRRVAVRRTQRDVELELRSKKAVADMTREELQAEAKKRDIDARQSSDALRKALA